MNSIYHLHAAHPRYYMTGSGFRPYQYCSGPSELLSMYKLRILKEQGIYETYKVIVQYRRVKSEN